MKRTRLTFNVNFTHVGPLGQNDAGLQDLLRVLNLWRPRAVLLMNAATPAGIDTRAFEVRNLMSQWGGRVIIRLYSDSEQSYALSGKFTPTTLLRSLASQSLEASGFWVNIGNEETPATEADMRAFSKFYADVGFLATSAFNFTGVVLPNFAIAAIPREWIDAGAADALLEMFAAQSKLHQTINGVSHSRVILGVHDYTHAHRGVGEGVPYAKLRDWDYLRDPRQWFSHHDLNVEWQNNWLAGRHLWMYNRMLQQFGHLMEHPDAVAVDFTEYDLDNMGNVYQVDPETAAFVDRYVAADNIRVYDMDNPGKTLWTHKVAKGRMTVQGYYAAIVEGMDGVDVWDYNCLQWAHDERMFPDHVQSMCIFTWSWHGKPPFYWATITNVVDARLYPVIDRWPQYKAELEDEWNALPAPDDEAKQNGNGDEQPVTRPNESNTWYQFKFNENSNLRDKAAGTLISQVHVDKPVYVVNHVPVNKQLGAASYDWIEVVNHFGVRGFMALFTNQQFIILEEQLERPGVLPPLPDDMPDEPPPPDTDPDLDLIEQFTHEELLKMASVLRSMSGDVVLFRNHLQSWKAMFDILESIFAAAAERNKPLEGP